MNTNMTREDFIKTFAHFMSENDLNKAYDRHFGCLGNMNYYEIKKWLEEVLNRKAEIELTDREYGELKHLSHLGYNYVGWHKPYGTYGIPVVYEMNFKESETGERTYYNCGLRLLRLGHYKFLEDIRPGMLIADILERCKVKEPVNAEWIKVDEGKYKCSACGEHIYTSDVRYQPRCLCGAKMNTQESRKK